MIFFNRTCALTPVQRVYLTALFEDRTQSFDETVELPIHIDTVASYLYGPAMGDEPVPVFDHPDRRWRTFAGAAEYPIGNCGAIEIPVHYPGPAIRTVPLPARPTYKLTIVAEVEKMSGKLVVEACYGGPYQPPPLSVVVDATQHAEQALFWRTHALGVCHDTHRELYNRFALRLAKISNSEDL